MANPEHLALVGRGAEAIAEWRRAHPRASLDLSGANLMGADLRWADLSRANLSGGKLRAAYLANADLTGATFVGADLTGAELAGTDLSEATLGNTSLGELDLSQTLGLATVEHLMPSSIGVDTLIASFRGAGNRLTPELAAFFRGAGVPQELLMALPAILAQVKYCTCFIAYGQPDLDFARKLRQDLTARGVSCWIYDMDATLGERTWWEIGLKRREMEKMVVLCSMAALFWDGVLKEIEEQIDEDSDKMVPISLDDLWKERGFKIMRGDRDLKPFLLDKNYADFANLPYDQALERLLRGLSRRDAEISRR